MTRKEMIELVKKLQAEGEQCHNCQLELYITVEGELRTQLMTGRTNTETAFSFWRLFKEKTAETQAIWSIPSQCGIYRMAFLR